VTEARALGNVVIVGGGFAGTTAARALSRRLPPTHRVVLLSEESYTTFNPMLAEVVGASVFPEHVVAPIRQMLEARDGRSRFIMGKVTAVDFERRELQANTLAGVQAIDFEQLVLAFGARADLGLLPGLAEHALPLKLVGDATCIRNRVLQRIARIELERDPVARQRLGHFIVIGGAFSGVEVADAIADFLRGARTYYPRLVAGELKVSLLHDAARLLPELPTSLAAAAKASLMTRGVEVRLQARVAGVEASGVSLSDGDWIPGATVVCTIGTRPNPLVERLGLATERGRIRTAGDLAVPGFAGTWAIGDCAFVMNGACGEVAPPTAQFAVAEAKALARNIVAVLAGRPTRAFAHRSRGMMATTGHLKGVAEVFGLRVSGLAAWLLWRAYYLSLMPTLGRKLRIWLEWSWSMFVAADITHLRFTRSSEADVEPAPSPPLAKEPS
jgi:NADH dehydrogenase